MIFTVQTKFKSIENDSKDRIKEIKDIESVFFNLENNKYWHTYIFDSAQISEMSVEFDNVPTFASKRITLNLKHDKKSNTHKGFNYEKGNMVIVTRNKVYHIYDFELFYESESTIVFDIEDIREKDRDFTIYPKREISNLNVELSFDNRPVNLDKNNKEDIKIKRINRTEYILNEISKWGYIDIDNTIENIKTLDSKFPGKNYLYELKLGNKTMTYSDEFVKNMLKDEYIKHLKDEQDKIDAMKKLKELDIKVPSMEELKDILDMGYNMDDINRFISKTYKDWDMKPCCTLEYLKDSL